MTAWLTALGKDNTGSRPRCVLLTDGSREEVAARLTQIVDRADVMVAADDYCQPQGKCDLREIELDKVPLGQHAFVDRVRRQRLKDWWLAARKNTARTPNWDIVSSCDISGREGLLLVEAKAHAGELQAGDRCYAKDPNRQKTERATAEANVGLRQVTGGAWNLSTTHHYQLSNRFAWSWELASLGVPVVLVYLGFLNAQEMPDPQFHSEADWNLALRDYGRGIVDESCWSESLDVTGTPLLPLIRVAEVPFDPDA